MIISINIHHKNIGERIDFETKPLGIRKKVLYQATLEKIIKSPINNNSKLIIPDSLSGYDYNFETLIAYIRIDKNEVLARIPIMVLSLNKNDLFDESKEFQKLLYEKIGVTFTRNPDDNAPLHIINDGALKIYLRKAVESPCQQGNHDNSNRWGLYVLAASLCAVDKKNSKYIDLKSSLASSLAEEIYYKQLIQEFNSTYADENLVKRLQKERKKLHKIFPTGTVLVVEDQLDDGWRDAYCAIFSMESNVKFLFAEDEIEAKEHVHKTKNIDLILLDVRLAVDRDKEVSDISDLSGVELAKWIRKKMPTVPIIAATASNKAWTLEALLEQGINGYWVKGSPDFIDTASLGLKNTLDLYKKTNSTLKWAQRTRAWQQELYRIADVVEKSTINRKLSERLLKKAKSLQALLFRSFSPFSNELSNGLQMNLAFLEIYSCINDVVLWVCSKYEDNEKVEYRLDNAGGEVVVTGEKNGNKHDWFFPYDKNRTDPNFPDRFVAERVISLMQDSFADKSCNYMLFKKLADKRNGLPLIHGKADRLASASNSVEAVSDEDIDNLVNLISEIVNYHAYCLKTKKVSLT